jgi:hypothetical protein
MSTNIIFEPAEPRTVLLHYHLMKNAGTTLAAVLEREFGAAFSQVHRANSSGHIDSEDIVALLRSAPHLRALSSHHFTFPVPRARGFVFIDVCPIRHPIDRLGSLYHYFRTTPHDDELAVLAKRFDVGAFLRIALDRYPNYAHNVQTVALGNENVFRPMSEDDVRRAVDTLRRTAFVAVVNRFEESLCAAEYYLRPALPKLRLHFTVQNYTRSPQQGLADRLAELENRCSTGLLDDLCAATRGDAVLFEAANEELDRRIAAIPSFEARLMKFRERCAEAEVAAESAAV